MGASRGGPVERGERYRTLDGSMVTELARPERGGSRNVSVAETVIEPGQATLPHYHLESDEVYYILNGKGVVSLGENLHQVEPGSCAFIPAGQIHSVRCEGPEPLRILCICSPPYTHEGTTTVD